MVNKKIQLLDCTLRDGGYVNNFEFGINNIKKIANSLSLSGVDLIELGFLKDGSHSLDQSLYNSVSEAEDLIYDTKNFNQNYCLMIRPDWFDISKLTLASGYIKNIRFAFHYKDLKLTLYQAEIAKSLGYEVMFNPVNILSYSKNTLETLLPILNEFNPKCVSIVDTFGSLLPNDLNNLCKIFNDFLNEDIEMGLHLHENLSISLALAIFFIDLVKNSRNIYIDSSVLGIGRIPGNLCTELIMNFLNNKMNYNYKLEHIYNLIDDPILSIKMKEPWGYMPAYAYTAFNGIHRSYAEFLYKKPDLELSQIINILEQLSSNDKKNSFDNNLAEKLYNDVKNLK